MLILASGSPRRRELLKKITPDFQVVISDVDEKSIRGNNRDLPVKISQMKAYAVFQKYPEDTILASDTIVLIDQDVVGKPIDQEDAKNILRKLSGREHLVITGYTIICKEYELSRRVISKVFFNTLSEDLIDRYAKTGSPMDKAGAYGIQDKDFQLVHHIEGSYDNIMGFPTEDIAKHLK
jgi:septum formation protein